MRQSGAIQVSEAGSESTVGRGGMRRHWPVLALLLGLCWAGGAMAQEGYPHAEQVHRQVAARDDYMLALGHIRRMGALWQPSESLRLSGELERQTWLLPEGRSPAEAHQWWLEHWQPNLWRVLYSCRGQACGSSHRWAGVVFEVRELAGTDGSQHYDVVELEGEDGALQVAALYTVQRGNRRVYSQLDRLALAAGQDEQLYITADTLVRRLREPGSLVLAVFTEEEEAVTPVQREALVTALRKDVRLELELVGHGRGEEARQQGHARAEALQRQLVEAGIAPERIAVVEARGDATGPGARGWIELRRRQQG